MGYQILENNNWHAAPGEGLAGEEENLEGEVDMEDDDIIELDPEEEEPEPAEVQRWRLMGRYINVRRPNIDDMTDHFNDVWHLRTWVNFAPLGKNWFNITLFSEGDYNFVARGGPWIDRGYPLLVGKIKDAARPSEIVLDWAPLWVQVYDIPWNRQKKKIAQIIGAKLGKYLEANLDADGRNPYDFLHVHVDIPVDRRLRPSITTQVKGSDEISTFLVRYERVPYFCFWCGFIGHDDTDCEKKGKEFHHWGDTVMTNADSILGKRSAEEQEELSEDRSKAMVVLGEVSPEGKLKKGRLEEVLVRELGDLTRATQANLVFLCETRQKVEKVRRLKGRLGLRGFEGVDSDGLNGGLALFWDDRLKVEVQAKCERYIDVHIRLAENESQWHLTCVYGEPRVENRHNMWTLLQNLKAQSDLPWCVLGDFNEAMWSFEHFSATKRAESQMLAFRDVLEVCELIDLGFSGVPYTYDNKRRGRKNVKVRLDRVVADNRWHNLFTEARVMHKVSPCSNHCPIVLHCVKEEERVQRPHYKRYEVMWEREPSLPEHISNAWAAAGPKADLGKVTSGLNEVMKHLQEWSKIKFGSVKFQLEKSRTRLEELMNMNADRDEIRAVTDQMNELLYREEMMWMQRLRIDWLREGDRNTIFFHSKAVWRARKNRVKHLVDDHGVRHDEQNVMGQIVRGYFEGIFSADPALDPNRVLSLIEPKV
ncbi:hypothetical protein ACQ4PT_033835 [Festuca glaucescens]